MSQTITPQRLQTWLFDGQEIALFDVREHGQYGEAHLFHGVNLPYSRLELEVRRLAPNPGVRLVIYDQDGGTLALRAAEQLRTLNYTRVHRLEGGADGWQAAGLQLFAGVHVPSKAFGEIVEEASHTPHISATELAAWQAKGEPLLVLDGRPFDEYRKMTIPGSICCPNGELGYRLADLVSDDTTPIVVNCAGRTRSIIGAQTLIDLGVKNPVYALENGTQGWYLADLPLEHGSSRRYTEVSPQASLDAQRQAAQQLAQRAGVVTVEAAQVAKWAEDRDRSLFLCDVRTPEEFALGSLPGVCCKTAFTAGWLWRRPSADCRQLVAPVGARGLCAARRPSQRAGFGGDRAIGHPRVADDQRHPAVRCAEGRCRGGGGSPAEHGVPQGPHRRRALVDSAIAGGRCRPSIPATGVHRRDPGPGGHRCAGIA
jgi:cystathionine beta-lyase